MKAKINKITIELTRSNLLTMDVDAIVVVTDPNLTVRDDIGDAVREQTRRIGWSDVGTAVMTEAGNISNVMKIIHAVAPRWGEGSERGKLANVTWECLRIAENAQLKNLAMPPISVGLLGYPVESCAHVMLGRIIDYTFEDVRFLRHIYLNLNDDNEFDVFEKEFQQQLRDLRENGEGKVRV
jgi:O-acetyl-ADP-ribose deacetylase (regulator of RNase III)